MAFALALTSGAVIYYMRTSILTVPRDAIPFLATVLATLLGLTFTAFAIISAFMPNLREDYVSTHTFMNIGTTFFLTLLIQFISLILSFFSYLLYYQSYVHVMLFFTITGTIFSFGFLGTLIWGMFRIFRIARNKIVKGAQ